MDRWGRIRYHQCLPMGENGTVITGSKKHIDLARYAAGEGMVLLKNDGTLPLENGTRVAIFGKAQIDYVQGGGGCAVVYSPYTRNVYEGFKIKEEEGKVVVNEVVSSFYKDVIKKQFSEGVPENRTTEVIVPQDIVDYAKENSDLAVIIIGRLSVEGWDKQGGKGDYYLSDEEVDMIEKVTKAFDKVAVVIDAGLTCDTSWFYNNDKINSVLYAWQAGMEGGLAIADILCGDVNPSGKITDTFAKDLYDYPSTESFKESEDYVEYTEDIYVGYRYFETMAKDKVNYPFGFGLSYTTFDINILDVYAEGEKVFAEVEVKNTGNVAGKEVVQLYYSAPQGFLGKPAIELGGFKKTKLLAPGESEIVTISMDIEYMSSFDDTGKVQKSAYIFEKGEYNFYIGNSVRNTEKADFSIVYEEDVVLKQLSQLVAPEKLTKRLNSKGEYEAVPSIKTELKYKVREEVKAKKPEEHANLFDVTIGKVTMDEFIAQLSEEEMISFVSGQPAEGIADTCGMGNSVKYIVPNVMTADGAGGLRASYGRDVYTTAFPCATLLACSWDPDLLFEVAKTIAVEVIENGIGIWLAPGINIHRNPLCGRNFEYFSEDPYVSAQMAIAEINGCQSMRIPATIKHFACNNKETNRLDSDSRVSERALREIYIKGFEIAIKEAKPKLLMTAYNIVNGIRTSEHSELIEGILRDEWGYEGLITSDWTNNAEHHKELKAGNDIKMPEGQPDKLRDALKNGFITKADLQTSTKRLMELIITLD